MARLHRQVFRTLYSSSAVWNTHPADSPGVRIRHASGIIKLWEDLLATPPTEATPRHADRRAASDEQWRQAEALLKSQLRAFESHTEGALLPEWVHQHLISFYKSLAPDERTPFLLLLTSKLGLQESEVSAAVRHWQQCVAPSHPVPEHGRQGSTQPPSSADMMLRAAERLRVAVQPLYTQLFGPISREPDGIQFLVSLRAHVRDALAAQPSLVPFRALETHLKSCLTSWFTPGLLTCQPLTWATTPAALLDKLVQYEAVHPVRSLEDLRRRLGPDRRVHAYFHPCLPGEPLVILHAALMQHVPASLDEVLHQPVQGSWAPAQPAPSNSNPALQVPEQLEGQTVLPSPAQSGNINSALSSNGKSLATLSMSTSSGSAAQSSHTENAVQCSISEHAAQPVNTNSPSGGDTTPAVDAAAAAAAAAGEGGGMAQAGPSIAVFYSISSTQPGLAGVDLGHFLIRDVAHKVQAELPSIRTLVTLSPMPGFRRWLQSKLAAQAIQEADTENAGHLAQLSSGSKQWEGQKSSKTQAPRRKTSREEFSAGKSWGSASPAEAVTITHTSRDTRSDDRSDTRTVNEGLGRASASPHVRPMSDVETETAGGWVTVQPNVLPTPPLITPVESAQLLAAAPQLLNQAELAKLSDANSSPAACLALVLESATWVQRQTPAHLQSPTHALDEMLQGLLQRAAARYLLLERRRFLALDPVAHFHLRNGAQLLRINVRGDLSPGGWQRSYGLMVNYLYLLQHADANNKAYLVDHNICAAASCVQMLSSL